MPAVTCASVTQLVEKHEPQVSVTPKKSRKLQPSISQPQLCFSKEKGLDDNEEKSKKKVKMKPKKKKKFIMGANLAMTKYSLGNPMNCIAFCLFLLTIYKEF